ncbi:MAG: hypothetical protein ACFFA6_14870 [Promethearchaeota archaeon]
MVERLMPCSTAPSRRGKTSCDPGRDRRVVCQARVRHVPGQGRRSRQ